MRTKCYSTDLLLITSSISYTNYVAICKIFYKKTYDDVRYIKKELCPSNSINVTKFWKRASIFRRAFKHFCLLNHKLPETFTSAYNIAKIFSPVFSLNESMSEPIRVFNTGPYFQYRFYDIQKLHYQNTSFWNLNKIATCHKIKLLF